MFHGSIVALITPMHSDGSIDYLSLEKLIQWHLENKTQGILILGTTGESPTIEQSERRKIIELTLLAVNHKIPVMVGTGSNSTNHSIALTTEAMQLGADAVLIVTPYYNKPTQEGLFQHYRAIAKAVPIPQILYNIPPRTACDLLPETIARLSSFSNILGIKEGTGDVNRLKILLSLDLKIDYFTSNDDNALEFMLQGGQGAISVAANVIPKLFSEFCDAALQGDVDIAKKMDQGWREFYRLLFIETNPMPVKWIMEKMGLIQSGIRLPLTPLSVAHHADMQALLQELKLI